MVEFLRGSDSESRFNGGLGTLLVKSEAALELSERGLLLSYPCCFVIWACLAVSPCLEGDSDCDPERRSLIGARMKGDPLMFVSAACNPARRAGLACSKAFDSSSPPGEDMF